MERFSAGHFIANFDLVPGTWTFTLRGIYEGAVIKRRAVASSAAFSTSAADQSSFIPQL